VSKPDTKSEIKIICNVVPGKVSEHQKHLWMLVWRRLKSVKLDRKILIPRTEIERLLRPSSQQVNTNSEIQRIN